MEVMFDPKRDLHAESSKYLLPPGVVPPADCVLKDWIKEEGYGYLRNAAKTVNFGIIYQRGAGALSRQVGCDFDEAQGYIDAVYAAYPNVRDYVDFQKSEVENTGYAENPYGRRRYFFESESQTVMKAQERESVNFPIQSCIADTLPIAMMNFVKYREEHSEHKYKVLLPFHDAIYLHVPIAEVYDVVNKVVPLCMTERAEIPNIGLKLQTDCDVYYHWEEKTTISGAIAQSLMAK